MDLSSTVGKWGIRISISITLNFVLHLPNVSCNLISISQLTKTSQWDTIFLFYCVFHDLFLETTISNLRKGECLYYFAKAKASELSNHYL